MDIEFEFDPSKSQANKVKHGIDFVEAQALWEDDNLLEVPARTEDEPRLMMIGRIGGQVWSAIVTPRGERLRIISVRASRREERELYEGEGV